MTTAIVITLVVAGAVVGVLVKVGLDLRGFVNERRDADGRVTNDVRLGVLIVLLLVAMILLWLLLGLFLGDTSEVVPGG